jgi:hypothetical protein
MKTSEPPLQKKTSTNFLPNQNTFFKANDNHQRQMPRPHPPSNATPISYDGDTHTSIGDYASHVSLEQYKQSVIDYAMEALNNRDYVRLITILRAYNSEGDERMKILSESTFVDRLEQVIFDPVILLDFFAVIEFKENLKPLHIQLNNALRTHNAELIKDLLAIIMYSKVSERYLRYLRNAIIAKISAADQLEALQLIDNKSSRAHLLASFEEAHYEDENGKQQLKKFTNKLNSFVRFSGNELRFIVRIFFYDKIEHSDFMATDLFTVQSKINLWMAAINAAWNNRFFITNGINSYDLSFVPTVISYFDDTANPVNLKRNKKEKCDGVAEEGRANELCWFADDDPSVMAHEFGHMLGALDEYRLPANSQEISNAGISINADSLPFTSVEGINNTENSLRAPGTPLVDRKEFQSDSIMGNGGDPQTRHLLLLINEFNKQLPWNVIRFQVARRS